MFLTQSRLRRLLDPERIVAAIRAAEVASTAEIRVSVSGARRGDPRARAEKAFHRLGMANTRQRNGVLIYLMPLARRYAVIGDAGIHAAVGQAFWDDLGAAMARHFAEGDFTGGLEAGIAEAGQALALHFPAGDGPNPDELPDRLDLEG
ncbi:MAG TPA: TPM domain-containing protein [Holophagaceae bacterium]|nr:TPM domain-containing protein [Holophagaceae bacterium]